MLRALSPLSTNLPVLNRLGIKQVAVLDARPGQEKKYMTAVWNDQKGTYEAFFKGAKKKYELPSDEAQAERHLPMGPRQPPAFTSQESA